MAKFAPLPAEEQPVNNETDTMKSSVKPSGKRKKTTKVIKNAHSATEQRAMGDRWAEHTGPYMTLAETLTFAAEQKNQSATHQPTDTH